MCAYLRFVKIRRPVLLHKKIYIGVLQFPRTIAVSNLMPLQITNGINLVLSSFIY